ncbi:hypothetical protein [Paenibacillus lutrae]|uniref:hypothetical protein n=1 Tax=Paenibacillus lutrae TaxID=2078573 RepID=UPI001F2A116F|nr:hypothetical protein [Paenibacillus lutrae]
MTAWLFPTGVTTHVLLAAALRNPTIRLRYLSARHVLMEYGCKDLYPDLLRLLGCDHMSSQRIEQHLTKLECTFDAAAKAAQTPLFFSTDITPEARRIAIGGSRELIRTGCHREAVFWIAATFARCHKILETDAPPGLQESLIPAFHAILADLGIPSPDHINRRVEEVRQFLPVLWQTTEAILKANPDIKRS